MLALATATALEFTAIESALGISTSTLSKQLKVLGEAGYVTLDKRKIHLEKALRTVGDHEVELQLHAEVTAKLKVHIKSSNPQQAAEAQAAALAAATIALLAFAGCSSPAPSAGSPSAGQWT